MYKKKKDGNKLSKVDRPLLCKAAKLIERKCINTQHTDKGTRGNPKQATS